MKLYYREFGEESHYPVVILHGLFGMSDNWVSIGKDIADASFRVFIPDQRNHGRSGHSDIHNYPAMVDDLLEFLDARELETVHLIGHSMGGKTAMQFAFDYPERINKLVVADISPSASRHGDGHSKLIDALLKLDLSKYESRNGVGDAMGNILSNQRLQQFLQKNVYWKDRASLGWRMNLVAVRDNLDNIFSPVESASPFKKPSLFIRGGLSDYIPDEQIPVIEKLFPAYKLKTIDGASHWLHAEEPSQFVKEVLYYLSE